VPDYSPDEIKAHNPKAREKGTAHILPVSRSTRSPA
jgi:hypothetical protein